jgi:hypothetical protein
MTSPEVFADAVAASCEAALSRVGARVERFSIGAMSIKLVAPCDEARPWIGRAFLPSPVPAAEAPDREHCLAIWDGTRPESLPPPRPWGPTAHEPLGVIAEYSTGTVRCAFDIHTSSLVVRHDRLNASYVWVPKLADLPAWALASPMRVPLSWLANAHGMQVVHAAAVAMGGRAVLLAGAGGSGKSTTALACAMAGMAYLGDDYCVVEPGMNMVHLLYRTAKLFQASLDMLPKARAWLCNPRRATEEKGVIFFDSSQVSVVPSAPLAAIVLPRLASGERTRISRASRREAIAALLPSTIGGLMGGTPGLILKAISGVPIYHLMLGTDLASITDTIRAVSEAQS